MKRKDYKSKLIIFILLIAVNFFNIADVKADVQLTDVHSYNWFYEDVNSLVTSGIINGYEDQTFRPNANISVAEFIKMALVASGTELAVAPEEPWYQKYVDTALVHDFIDAGYFTDYLRPITRGEMGNLIDRILALRFNNSYEYIPLISDYTSISENQKASTLNVFIAGIITGYADRTIRTSNYATRAEAATVIVRMLNESRRIPPDLGIVSGGTDSDTDTSSGTNVVTKAFSIDGIQIGSSLGYVIDRFGQPNEILGSSFGYNWYVFAKDYTTFKMVGIAENKVVALYSDHDFDSTYAIGIKTSDTLAKKALTLTEFNNYYFVNLQHMNIQLYSKKGVEDGIEGILITDDTYSGAKITSAQEQKDMEKILFYLVNSARKSYGAQLLVLSDQASLSAYKHSKDMAVNEYFSHITPSGVTFKTRMQNEGISATLFGENIAAGYKTAFDIHYAFMHSDSHKENILNSEYDHVGMGIYYLSSSTYGYYVTQNFFKIR